MSRVARGLLRLAVLLALVAAPVAVLRAWRGSRTQVHSISHGRG